MMIKLPSIQRPRRAALPLLTLGSLSLSCQVGAACPDYLDQTMRRLHSQESVAICEVIADRPALIVNTASHCGYTGQFRGLEALHQEYKDRGLVVLGFASDSFSQEADSEAEVANVCYVNYGVTFTMLAPTPVRGDAANAVFQALGEAAGAPKWNFNKYLIDANGNVIEHFDSAVRPGSARLSTAIEALL